MSKPLPPISHLRHQRLRLLLGAAVLFSSFCAYLSYQVIRKSTLENIERSALLEVQKGVDDIDQWLSNHQAIIETIANTAQSQSTDWEVVGPYLAAENTRLPDFVFLGLSNPQGMRYTTADNQLVNASDRQWFQRAIAGQPHIDDPFISRATGGPVIAISAPVPPPASAKRTPRQRAIGVIHGGVKIDRIKQYVNQINYGQQSYAFLLNSEGRAIIHPDPALMSTSERQAPSLLTAAEPDLAAMVQRMVTGKQGIGRIQIDGQTRYIAYLPLQSTNWSLALVIPLMDIDNQLDMLNLMGIVILGLTSLMLAALWRLHTFEQQQLAKAQTAALLDERNRLAREIHDTLAQAFTGVSLQLEAARGSLENLINRLTNSAIAPLSDPDRPDNTVEIATLKAAQACILRARDLSRQGLSEARRSVHALRSAALEDDSLPDALRKTLTQTQRDTGLTTHFYLEGQPIPLPDDIQLNLLRIAQEAITNTLRHANATQLEITLSFAALPDPKLAVPSPAPQVQLRIMDNGNGFDQTILSEAPGFGLSGMRERTARMQGQFELLSTPSIGTTIDVLIPLPSE
ncbi:hypothetical protein IQ266_10320 [filamentous cyanobacterium LEGE 11480]|uniref:Histidine kinase domain-containing protein n=1 Tax=Romeriopsis navalis LEGE 11480 TaxID=2777977 RepID=A0A928Z4A3_9CYAN|nr:cache domain-containing protein [Romeriopsis navalis]MBE9030123.1 hypothetical protein [Romeriopsis navalis LEGE 11480]